MLGFDHMVLGLIPNTEKERERGYSVSSQGMKEQKLKAKQKRDEEIEAERKVLDLEEEIYKEGERKKAIESARQCQFHQTERVKRFHVRSASLLLTYVDI